MSELLKINVNEHVEKKNGLSYLSWAWAWAEVLKIDKGAKWRLVDWSSKDGSMQPYCTLPDGSMLVAVEVTINDITRACQLPVMDHRNKAIKAPDAFAVNTAIMRCLAKAIAMHGLGLYIYAGEDLPEGEEPPKQASPDGLTLSGIGRTMKETSEATFAGLDEDRKRFIRQVAQRIEDAMPEELIAYDRYTFADLSHDEKVAIGHLLDSKTRSAIKRVAAATKEAA